MKLFFSLLLSNKHESLSARSGHKNMKVSDTKLKELFVFFLTSFEKSLSNILKRHEITFILIVGHRRSSILVI